MQGKKLTDAEILKWLEHCKNAGDCFPCPLSGTAYCIHSTTTAKVYYDFINRKQAEIELLYKVINQQDYAMKNAQAEAVKRFAVELKGEYIEVRCIDGIKRAVLTSNIDRLVKEKIDERI